MASRLTFSRPTGTPAAVGAELRAIRNHLALSQRRFAGRLGVHRTSVARWEAGVRPTPITVLHLARCLAEAHVAPPTFVPDPRATGVPVPGM
jgi:DNA-binding transcriptional regulator YiaG